MRHKYVPLAALALLAASAVGQAAEQVGTIKSIDIKANAITLTDGTTYALGKTVKIATLKAGEKVKITYDVSGKTMTASKVDPAK